MSYNNDTYFPSTLYIDHRCGNIVTSHLVGPGLIPCRVSFPDWGFFLGIFLDCNANDGKA